MNPAGKHYSGLDRILVAVDCIIFGVAEGTLNVLLIRRGFEPELGKWSLIGGFVRRDEGIDDAASRVLESLTGLKNAYIRQLGAFGDVGRDPGNRVVSIAYFALVDIAATEKAVLPKKDCGWFPVESLPPLGFDHERMIRMAVGRLRSIIMQGSIACNLLPPMFTMTQLQRVVEDVAGRKLDKRNFRKSFSENPDIEETGLIDKTSSRRGARLYRWHRPE